MELISDGLLLVAALTATLYCVVLGRRLRRLSDAGTGIADQIKLLDKTLDETRAALRDTQNRLGDLRGSARLTTEKLAREVKLAGEAQAALESARASLEKLLDAADGRSGTADSPPVAPGARSGGEAGPDRIACFDPLERGASVAPGAFSRSEGDAADDADMSAAPRHDGLLHADRVVL